MAAILWCTSLSTLVLSFVFSLLIIPILTSTVTQPTTAAAPPTHILTYCSNTTGAQFSLNSSYQENRNSVLSILIATNNDSVLGFRNATVGDNNLAVNGISMCLGHISDFMCYSCVSAAASALIKNCPYGKEGLTWYNQCLIRYSPFTLGKLNNASVLVMSGKGHITRDNFAQFDEILRSTSDVVAIKAAKGGEFRKFATKEATFDNDSRTLNILGQCTPELSQRDCEKCLKKCAGQFPICCSGKKSGRVISGSCYLMYETHLFYNNQLAPGPVDYEIGAAPFNAGGGSMKISDIVAVIIFLLLKVMVIGYFWCRCCILRSRKKRSISEVENDAIDNGLVSLESLQYNFATLQVSTNNFSDNNKIGQGGFGSVYKGTLPSGQEIAVKRLSRSSVQGLEELKNEMVLVANLQHRNLVRLLGFCLEGEEKLLVYQFVPNKSLDYFLFDHERQRELDWTQRYKIVQGIARGMLYLHEESRLRIIHRDIKASNVLLDMDMDPKISDFGMAKIFGGEQTQGMTTRVMGTYGYMAPEYMAEGQYSIKSDVYSFGVLVLEIVSGRKNNSFHSTDWAVDLLTHAWNLWSERRPYDFMDIVIQASHFSKDQVKSCIQIGLLCVHKDPEKRPTMAMVVHMLNVSCYTKLALPQRPGFFFGGSNTKQPRLHQTGEDDQSRNGSFPSLPTTNKASITTLNGR